MSPLPIFKELLLYFFLLALLLESAFLLFEPVDDLEAALP